VIATPQAAKMLLIEKCECDTSPAEMKDHTGQHDMPDRRSLAWQRDHAVGSILY